MKRVARMLPAPRSLILNGFGAVETMSYGIVEGFNNIAKRTNEKTYGSRTHETIEIDLNHQLGKLPKSNSTHKIW